MSAIEPVPTVADFLDAGAAAVRVDGDQTMNVRRGSVVDLTAGPAAMAWAQQASRDRDLFRDVYTDSARGARLEETVTLRYGVDRVQATRGQGKAILVRSSSAAGGGTLYEGTRIAVQRSTSSASLLYALSADYTVPAAAILAIQVDIQATRPGTGVKIDGPATAEIADVVYDPLWTVQKLWCADGTDEEAPEAYVARARTYKLDRRPGYRKRFEDVCKGAGAAQVVILDASELGTTADFGVTHVYVGDAGYSSPDALVNACSDAVDAVHVGGCDVQVLPMTPTAVTLTLTVSLWKDPGEFDLTGLRTAITSAVLAMFNNRPRFWLFDHDSIAGEVTAAAGDGAVQTVGVVTDPVPPTAAFVASLPRYTLAASAVSITFSGPT